MSLFADLTSCPQAYFVYLLRADLRDNLAIGETRGIESFLKWWSEHADSEYGADRLGKDLYSEIKWQKVPLKDDHHYHEVPKALRDLWLTESHLQQAIPLSQSNFADSLETWYLMYGVETLAERGERSLFSSSMKKLLLQPFWLDDEFEQQRAQQPLPVSGPYLTQIALLFWRADPELKKAFDLHHPAGQRAYLDWTLSYGVERSHCFGWLAQHWASELATLEAGNGIKGDSRFLPLLWSGGTEFQREIGHMASTNPTQLKNWLLERSIGDIPQLQQKLAAQRQRTATEVLRDEGNHEQGVNLVGYARGEIGIGEDVRTLALALEQKGIAVNIVDIPLPGEIRQADQSVDHLISRTGKYAINIFCMTGFETARLYAEQGDGLFKGRYNIGYWPWELAEWPEPWLPVFDLMDEIWASSAFTQGAYKAATDIPVRYLPLGVTVETVANLPRAAFDLPEEDYCFLFMFDFNSFMSRKNPLAVLRAFQQAFPPPKEGEKPADHEKVRLVFKVQNAKPDNRHWLDFQRRCAGDPRISFQTETMDKEKVLGLINTCDALVSLHRSEGFGRTLAEAFLLGKDVIATDYSGNVDFLDETNSYPVRYRLKELAEGDYFFGKGQKWADANIQHAAEHLRSSYENRNRKTKSARSLEKDGNPFCLERIGTIATQLLAQIPAWTASAPLERD
ncbi:glycosyltransferase [Rhodovibrionaceae bacterium A322]